MSVRLSRIQASWTASTASVRKPSIRSATPRKWERFALEALGEPVLIVHASRSCGRSGHVGSTREPPNM
jgi:hypothetical protein